MYDSRDAFYDKTSKEKANRSQLSVVKWVCGANVVMLLSYAFKFYWWSKYPIVAIIFGAVYIIQVFSSEHVKCDGATLFSDRYMRLRHWRDFYTSKEFIKSRYDVDHAPISNGDYLWLWIGEEAEYMKCCIGASSNSMDIDFNRFYNVDIKLTNPKDGKIMYTVKMDSVYGLDEPLYELSEQLKADGYIIKAVFNRFGDIRWKQSDEPKPPKKVRKLLYNIADYGSGIAALIAFITPLVPFIVSIYY